jgi:hypothetical protein
MYRSYKDREFDEVRGVMFEQTCFRELYFAGQVEKLLVKHNKPLANRPIGNSHAISIIILTLNQGSSNTSYLAIRVQKSKSSADCSRPSAIAGSEIT